MLVSSSTNVFENLALENWLHEDLQRQAREVQQAPSASAATLLLWRDTPCVVIGRNQNPWLESNVPFLRNHQGGLLARRFSGGGTVYHDLGNINISLITPRALYHKTRLTSALAAVLRSDFAIEAEVSERNDILVSAHKVSGSAYALTRGSAYHHCTLLLKSDLEPLRESLKPTIPAIVSRGVASERSPVTNVCDHTPQEVTFEDVCAALARSFVGSEAAAAAVAPSDAEYPGLAASIDKLASDEWIFNASPKFSLAQTRSFDDFGRVGFELEVVHGRLAAFSFHSELTDDITSLDWHLELVAPMVLGPEDSRNVFGRRTFRDALQRYRDEAGVLTNEGGFKQLVAVFSWIDAFFDGPYHSIVQQA